MRVGHLFAGAGGGLLASKILGHENVFAVELEHYPAEILRHRADGGWFPGLRVHEIDARLFDPSEYAGRVDALHAGWPCQDISAAGNGAGIHGSKSGLWSEVKRIAGELRPRELFLENSPNLVTRGLGVVLGDLVELGYDARWIVLPASAVGAPHIRARWWCLARRADTDLQRCGQSRGYIGGLADSKGINKRSMPERVPPAIPRSGSGGSKVPYAEKSGLSHGRQAGIAQGAGEKERRMAQPGLERCSRPWWAIEPDVGRVAHGVANRVDRIKAIGNGQVPLCAAAAYVLLSGEQPEFMRAAS